MAEDKKKKKVSSLRDLRKRMSDAATRNQREKKIDDLKNDSSSWKGLS